MILSIIAHESSSQRIPDVFGEIEYNAKGVGAARGLMQILGNTWNSYVDPEYTNDAGVNVSYFNKYKGFYSFAKILGAKKIAPVHKELKANDPRYDEMSNIAVGIAHLREWYYSSMGKKEWHRSVGRYGEGYNAESTYELLYYRDLLADQAGFETWYVGEYYDIKGKNLR